MKISNPQIIDDNGLVYYQVVVNSTLGDQKLWYSIQESHRELLTDTSDAFLVALLIPAMSLGEDIHVDGKISSKLLYNLSGPFQALIKVVIPSLKSIKIYPQEVVTECDKKNHGVATGFSGGIDSFCALADHYYSGIQSSYKITHLLFNNVGSHGKGGEELFQERYDKLLTITNIMGLPLVKINSNLNSFYSKNLDFKQTHTLRNASVALLLQGGISRFMYASAYHYRNSFVGPSDDTSCTDPITLPLLSTDALDSFSVGSEYTRVQKTILVSEVTDSYQFLDVCISSRNGKFTNCGKCSKCLRTLLTLEILKKIENYSRIFNLSAYRKKRNRYISTLFGSKHPMNIEIMELANQRNFSFPLSSKIFYWSGYSIIRTFLRRVRHQLKGK